MIDLSKEKLELDYPCNWSYKLVVLESININVTVEEIVLKREHTLSGRTLRTRYASQKSPTKAVT